MSKLSGEKFYKREYKKTFQMVDDQCKTAEQYAQICAMSLSRCQLQFAAVAEFFPQVDILPGYERILAEMERFVCDGAMITNEMLQGYVGWCLAIKRACENTNIGYVAPWRKRVLPDVIQSLGEAFSNWMCEEMYRSAIFYSDTKALIDIGADALFAYESSLKGVHPDEFNCYEFIRSCHPDIEEIGQKRDALYAFIESQDVQSKGQDIAQAREEFERLAQLFLSEGKKYLSEAFAEHKRLKSEYRPLVPEDLVLTTHELERIRADVQFVTTAGPTKEDIRQWLQYYRTLDITSEETGSPPNAKVNGI